MTMTPERERTRLAGGLTIARKALYGPPWQSDLTREPGVTGRMMHRWAAGRACDGETRKGCCS